MTARTEGRQPVFLPLSEAISLPKARKTTADRLRKNVIGGFTAASGVEGDGERAMYPQAWLWDTYITSAWTEDIQQGLRDVRRFFTSQLPNGRFAHMLYPRTALDDAEKWYGGKDNMPESGPITSRLTQPPVIGWGVLELANRMENSRERKEFIKEVFPQIMDYHDYLYSNLTRDNLLVTIHPWQNGDDNSPKWDNVIKRGITRDGGHKLDSRKIAADWYGSLGLPYARQDLDVVSADQRPSDEHDDYYNALLALYAGWGWDERTILERSPFQVGDPMNNAILQRSNIALKEIAEEIGHEVPLEKFRDPLRTIDGWITTTQQGLESLWDENAGLYYAKDLADTDNNQPLIKAKTVSSFVPLFSHAIPSEHAASLMRHIQGYRTTYPDYYLIPSVFPDQESFDPNLYWRAPVWLFLNEMIADGVEFYNNPLLARAIHQDTIRLGAKSQFENNNPITGEGKGAPAQSWTAAAVQNAMRKFYEVSENFDSHHT